MHMCPYTACGSDCLLIRTSVNKLLLRSRSNHEKGRQDVARSAHKRDVLYSSRRLGLTA